MNKALDNRKYIEIYINNFLKIFFKYSAAWGKRKGNMRSIEFPGERRQHVNYKVIFKWNQRIRNYVHRGYIGHSQNTKFNRERPVSTKQNKSCNICTILE